MRWGVVVVLLAMMVAGCSPKPIGAIVADTPREEWKSDRVVALHYDNNDTLSLRTLGMVARVESGAAEEKIDLVVECESPTGKSFESKVVLTPKSGQRGGSFREYEAEWVEDAQLFESGDYEFRVAPVGSLRGVWSVGITIR